MTSELLSKIPTYKHLLTDFVRSPEAMPFFHLLRDGQPMTPISLRNIFPGYGSFTQVGELIFCNNKKPLPGKCPKAVFTLMGPSTAGKDEVLKTASYRMFKGITRILTVTNRLRDSVVRREGLTSEYIFCSAEEIEQMIAAGQFIETVIQGGFTYGTPTASVEAALLEKSPFVVWRGDVNGSIAMRGWFAEHYPETPFVSLFVLPNMPPRQYFQRLADKRGWEDTIRWRLKRAIHDLAMAPSVADVILLNPPEPGGKPIRAAAAMCEFLESLRV